MTHVAKIIEIVGSSPKSWEDAAQVALAVIIISVCYTSNKQCYL